MAKAGGTPLHQKILYGMVAGAGAEVISFRRYQVGEGIERKAVDFAAEVAAQLQG